MTATNIAEADFDRLSWHDCCIWGIEFHLGDPEAGDWTSDLAFDIDFIFFGLLYGLAEFANWSALVAVPVALLVSGVIASASAWAISALFVTDKE